MVPPDVMADWSLEEVEATVADYLDMLGHEIGGVQYSKTAHRLALMSRLGNRSAGAIERKHQNISAVLIQLGFAYISGYKPLGNYQQLLYHVVADRLARRAALIEDVRRHVEEPADVPTVDDILTTLVEPPAPTERAYRPKAAQEQRVPRAGVDYLAMEARNRSLGSAGEEFVVRFEVARLIQAGQERLARRVERVSETQGDGLGYDVLSFDVTGRERLIEVKTTAYGAFTPFYVTRGEVSLSREMPEHYHIYRTFDFRRRPRLFWKSGAIDQAFGLEPSQFVASVR